MDLFDGTQREIGRGVQAAVFWWNGFAYKVYKKDYPVDWIEFELRIQSEIVKTGLNVVRYYETENPRVVRMDYIDGVTLADRVRKEKYKYGVEDLIVQLKEVHAVSEAAVPAFEVEARRRIGAMELELARKERALRFLDEIPGGHTLLHLDVHFENLMFDGAGYTIIDWCNARLGNSIYDYARTLVILNQFAFRMSKKFRTMIRADREIDTAFLDKATYVSAILRLREDRSEKTLSLLDSLESEGLE